MTLLEEFTNALDCCGTCAGGVLNRYRAEAWDQGYEAAAPEYVRVAYRGNPYRVPRCTQGLGGQARCQFTAGHECACKPASEAD